MLLEREHERQAANTVLARYGGEKFTLPLPETDREGAMVVAHRIQQSVHRLEIENEASPFNRKLSVSVGLGIRTPGPGITPKDLVDIADRALYEAKRDGRNCIFVRTC